VEEATTLLKVTMTVLEVLEEILEEVLELSEVREILEFLQDLNTAEVQEAAHLLLEALLLMGVPVLSEVQVA